MNKHLNNLLDKCEGLPENTSNKGIEKEIKRQKGRPEYGVQYSLTGVKGQKCIMNGNTWEESRITK